jgi:hypothetical protein
MWYALGIGSSNPLPSARIGRHGFSFITRSTRSRLTPMMVAWFTYLVCSSLSRGTSSMQTTQVVPQKTSTTGLPRNPARSIARPFRVSPETGGAGRPVNNIDHDLIPDTVPQQE